MQKRPAMTMSKEGFERARDRLVAAITAVLEEKDFDRAESLLTELEDASRSVVHTAGFFVDSLEQPTPTRLFQSPRLSDAVELAERQRIKEALARFGGDKTKAAALLGVSYRTLTRKCRVYGFG